MQFSKTSPLKSGECSEKSSGENRVKSCHICGCHGFFSPDKGFFLPFLRFCSEVQEKTLKFEKAPTSYRTISGPSGPKSQKSQKRVKKESAGPSGPRGPKSQKRVKIESKMTLFDSFLILFDSFRTLWTLGTGGPGRLFFDLSLTLLGFRARRARNGSVAGGGFLNLK